MAAEKVEMAQGISLAAVPGHHDRLLLLSSGMTLLHDDSKRLSA
jgi:hypothetical protein